MTHSLQHFWVLRFYLALHNSDYQQSELLPHEALCSYTYSYVYGLYEKMIQWICIGSHNFRSTLLFQRRAVNMIILLSLPPATVSDRVTCILTLIITDKEQCLSLAAKNATITYDLFQAKT